MLYVEAAHMSAVTPNPIHQMETLRHREMQVWLTYRPHAAEASYEWAQHKTATHIKQGKISV